MIIGTCSICRGAVQILDIWHGTQPQIPQCTRCKATKVNPYGSVIPMRRREIPIYKWGSDSYYYSREK